jgi:hypothetical protein
MDTATISGGSCQLQLRHRRCRVQNQSMVAGRLFWRAIAFAIYVSLACMFIIVAGGWLYPELVDMVGRREVLVWGMAATIVVLISIPAAVLHIANNGELTRNQRAAWIGRLLYSGPWAAARYF